MKPSHESMLRALACNDGEDKDLAEELRVELYGDPQESSSETTNNCRVSASSSGEKLADEYVKYRRVSLRVEEDDILSSSEILQHDVLTTDIDQNNSPLQGVFGPLGSAKIVKAIRDQHVYFES